MSQLYTMHSIDIHRLKVKGQKQHTIKYQSKKAEVAIFISDNLDFKSQTLSGDKIGHYKIIKWSIQQNI